MNTKAVDVKVKLTRYQVYLSEELEAALKRYITENYGPNIRMYTATFNRALTKFLKEEGYLK